mgnify:CR=1 FL=1
MHLQPEQLQAYQDQGYLLVENCFSPTEIEVMKAELPGIYADAKPGTIVEKDDTTIRAIYGAHTYNQVFGCLSKQARIIEPIQQFLGSSAYVHQFHINAKKALTGDVYLWHQDYAYHLKEDAIPTPRVAIAIVFLDEVHEFNSPLMVIPGSHKEGLIAEKSDRKQHDTYKEYDSWIANVTSNINYALDEPKLKKLTKKYGTVAPKGSAGSIIFLHPNCVHGSTANIYPFDRTVVVIVYNSVDNLPLPLENPRPDFLASRDYSAIEPLAEPICN